MTGTPETIEVTKAYLADLIKEVLGPEIAEIRKENEAKGRELVTSHMAGFFAAKANAPAPAEKGRAFTHTIRALAATKGDVGRAKDWIAKHYGKEDPGLSLIESGVEEAGGLTVKALGSNIFSAGGALTRPGETNEIIELLRPASVVRSLNPKIVPLDTGTLPIPRLQGGATASYAGENTARNASEPKFGDVTLTARELGCLVPLSNKLLNVASYDVDTIVRDDALMSVGTREDLAFLRGDGAENTPVGMRNWAAAANVFAVGGGNTLTTITAGLKTFFQKLATANVRMIRPGWIWSPTVEIRLMTIQDTQGHYVFRDEMAGGTFWGSPFRKTTQMLDTEVFYSDFADMVIGQMSTITVDASGTAAYNDSTGAVVSAYSRNQTVVRLITNNDFASRHDESIAVGTGVDWS